MEQNLEPVDTPLTSMSQDQAQNVESTRSTQTTKNQAKPIVPHVGAYAAQCSRCFKLRSIPSKRKYEKICANTKRPFVCANVSKWRPENQAKPIVPHVGAYAAQCSRCFKLRSIPSKRKYEKICANTKRPFVCANVSKWRPEVTCNNDADLPEDGSLKFAIEKQNIARPPLGWKRLVKIRRDSEGARFADVYYFSPSGRRLRSNTDIERYLRKHPDEAKRVRLSQFSFQPPKPAYRLKRSSDV